MSLVTSMTEIKKSVQDMLLKKPKFLLYLHGKCSVELQTFDVIKNTVTTKGKKTIKGYLH